MNPNLCDCGGKYVQRQKSIDYKTGNEVRITYRHICDNCGDDRYTHHIERND
jgi:hypothetical protein